MYSSTFYVDLVGLYGFDYYSIVLSLLGYFYKLGRIDETDTRNHISDEVQTYRTAILQIR
jgi:hypothetical protein